MVGVESVVRRLGSQLAASIFAQYPTRSHRLRQGVLDFFAWLLTQTPRSCDVPADSSPERSGAVLSEPDRFRDLRRKLMSDERPASPPAEVGNPLMTRRRLLYSGAAGAAAAYGLTASGAAARSLAHVARQMAHAGTVTVGSNYSDPVPKKAMAAVFSKFSKQSGTSVKVNTVDHNTFQEQINSYLQGRPDDVFTWFAGYRMQFFAAKGLATPIDDVWQSLKPQFSPALQAASKGLDGHYYFVTIYNYPWAVFYRKSVFQSKGYTIPKTWDQFLALAKKMKDDGMTPIAFTDKDGWPAMGTFDIINMRTNGYDFHVSLMAGKQSWDSPQVKAVFSHWS